MSREPYTVEADVAQALNRIADALERMVEQKETADPPPVIGWEGNGCESCGPSCVEPCTAHAEFGRDYGWGPRMDGRINRPDTNTTAAA